MNPDLFRDSQLRLLWTARIDYNTGTYPNSFHKHDDFDQLLILLSGDGVIKMEHMEVFIQSGEYCLFRKGEPHKLTMRNGTITLDYKFKIIDSSLEHHLSTIPPQGVCKNQAIQEFKLWHKLSLQYMKAPQDLLPCRIDAGFKSTLLSLGVNDSNLPVREELLHAPEDFPIAQYIKAHYHENLTLQTLAKQFNYNPHYLIEVFQTKMGVTPSHYGFEMQSPKS